MRPKSQLPYLLPSTALMAKHSCSHPALAKTPFGGGRGAVWQLPLGAPPVLKAGEVEVARLRFVHYGFRGLWVLGFRSFRGLGVLGFRVV